MLRGYINFCYLTADDLIDVHALKSFKIIFSTQDTPPLVSPSTDKLDLECLFCDLPKYKPWPTAQSWDSWETFIANDKELKSIKPMPWEFLELQHNAASVEVVRRSIQRVQLYQKLFCF